MREPLSSSIPPRRWLGRPKTVDSKEDGDRYGGHQVIGGTEPTEVGQDPTASTIGTPVGSYLRSLATSLGRACQVDFCSIDLQSLVWRLTVFGTALLHFSSCWSCQPCPGIKQNTTPSSSGRASVRRIMRLFVQSSAVRMPSDLISSS